MGVQCDPRRKALTVDQLQGAVHALAIAGEATGEIMHAAVGIQTLLEAMRRSNDCVETIADARRAPSAAHGTGLFSTRKRPPGELVCLLDGQSVSLDQFPEVLDLEWNALSDRVLLVRPLRTSYGYINHSDTPNLAIEPSGLRVITLRAIEAGEELTLDYFAPPLPPEFLDSPEAASLRATRVP